MRQCGRFVDSFAEASHALPLDMHMNADYPFMIPETVNRDSDKITIAGRGGRTITFTAKKKRNGMEFGVIEQASSFETIFKRRPKKFIVCPFKDQDTPAFQAARISVCKESLPTAEAPR